MATLPTPEQCGKKVLDAFRYFNTRPGEVEGYVRLFSFFQRKGWREDDLVDGLNYAIAQNWIEFDQSRRDCKLTETGFAAI